MVGVFVCLGGAALIVAIGEILWRRKILRGEGQRKFVHIVGGTFAAAWPWITSWRAIQLLSLVLLIGVLANRYKKFSNFTGNVKRQTYGDIFSALAILLCSSLTNEPAFYAIAILNLALADGAAAALGTRYGKRWRYKVFGQTKSIIGTMAFWLVSLTILALAVPFTTELVPLDAYILLVIFLPPVLASIENLSVLGSDNVTLPLAVLVALGLAAGGL